MAATASAFEAYTPQLVVDQFARKIDSLCVWNDTLLAGLSDGSLLCFQEQAGKGSVAHGRWQVTAVHKGFGRRTISQLQVLGSEPLLLSLSDDGVNLHSLPDLRLHGQASRTAKATAFAWDQARHLLAVAGKKKVSTHSLSSPGNEFLELTEYALPENAVALSWVQSNIIVGTKKSMWLIVPQPPQAVEVLPGQHMQLYPTVAPQLLFPAGAALPLITPLPGGQGEVLVTKDGHSFFIQSDGKVSRKAQLQWSAQPLALVAGDLYAVALLPQCVEVKSVSRISGQTVTQIMPLPDMGIAAPTPAPDGSIYIASSSEAGIRRLAPVPLPRQARLLAGSGDFQAALELCGRLPDGDADARRMLEDSLRLQFGHRLFEEGEYDEGLTQFSMCSEASPLVLLRLFPSLVPPKFQQFLPDSAYGEPLPEAPSASSTADAVAVVIPYLLSHRTRILASLAASTSAEAASTAAGADEDETSRQRGSSGGNASSSGGGVSSVGTRSSRGAASPLGSKQQASKQDGLGAGANGRGPGSSGGGGGGGGGRGQKRQQSNKAGSGTGNISSDSEAGGSPKASLRASTADRSVSPPKRLPGSPMRRNQSASVGDDAGDAGDASAAPAQQLRLVATIIDTAIMLAMLRQPDSGALLRLLQQQNYVDLDEGVGALGDTGRYAELVALYQYNARHAEGLELLRRLSQDAASLPAEASGVASDLAGLPGVWAAVRYLVSMHPQDLKVVRDHATWILEADPEAGLEAFLHMRPPLPPKVVLPILQSCAPDYCPVYLESALDMGLASPDEFHSELLLMYLSMALEEEAGGQESAAQHARKLSLSDLLVNRPHTPLKLFPDDPKQWNTAPFAAAPPTASTRGRRAQKSSGRVTPVALRARAGAAAAAAGGALAGGSPRSPSPAPGTPKGVANGGLSDEGEGMELASFTQGTRPDAYQRLRDLVYSSPHIDPEYVLAKLPPSSLLEIRALMLERLGRHREALTLYVHGLKDLQLAEAYCDRVYAAAAGVAGRGGAAGGLLKGPGKGRGARSGGGRLALGEEPADIYIELVEAVVQGAREAELQPLPLDANTWQQLCGLLSRKLDRIDATHVLDMLPPDLPLGSALTLLGSALLHCTETGRNLSVVRSLRRWENLSLREDLVSAKQRSVLLSQERACCLCHKRIGNGSSVFVAYPNGSLAHYLCFKRAGGAAVGAPTGVISGSGADVDVDVAA